MAVADPDNGTTNISIDVVNQGSADALNPAVLNMAEQRVYLCYGDNTIPDDDIKTNNAGEFEFKNLQIGTYKVYVISDKPPVSGEHQEIAKSVTIASNESITDAGTFLIYH